MSFETRDYQRAGYSGGGGGFQGGPTMMIPVPAKGSVTFWLLIANIAVFFVDGLLARGMGGYQIFENGPVLRPIEAWTYFSSDTAVQGLQLWRWFTFQFQHSDLGHLLGNMLGLFFFGSMIERHFGSRRFLAFWLLCGVAGAVAYELLWISGVIISHGSVPLVGASAGVFGMLAAAALIAPNSRVLLFFVIPIPLRVLVWAILGIAAYVVLAQGASPGSNAGGEAAHLGGALLGFLLVKNASWLNFADRMNPQAIQDGWTKGRYEKLRKQEQGHAAEVDRILAKVQEHGLQSLTAKEKKTLSRDTDAKRKAS